MDPQLSRRMRPFRNSDTDPVPPYGIVQLEEVVRVAGLPEYRCKKHERASLAPTFTTSTSAVPGNQFGDILLDDPVWALYDMASTPEPGEDWGPDNSWELKPTGSGYIIIGLHETINGPNGEFGRVLVQRSGGGVARSEQHGILLNSLTRSTEATDIITLELDDSTRSQYDIAMRGHVDSGGYTIQLGALPATAPISPWATAQEIYDALIAVGHVDYQLHVYAWHGRVYVHSPHSTITVDDTGLFGPVGATPPYIVAEHVPWTPKAFDSTVTVRPGFPLQGDGPIRSGRFGTASFVDGDIGWSFWPADNCDTFVPSQNKVFDAAGFRINTTTGATSISPVMPDHGLDLVESALNLGVEENGTLTIDKPTGPIPNGTLVWFTLGRIPSVPFTIEWDPVYKDSSGTEKGSESVDIGVRWNRFMSDGTNLIEQ